MFGWIKKMFSPKVVLVELIDALDMAVPYIAVEIDSLKGKSFNQLSSKEQAQIVVDMFQLWIKKRFGLDA